MSQTKVVEKIKTLSIFCNIFFVSDNRAFYELIWKNTVDPRKGHRSQYGACSFHTGYVILRTHTQNTQCNTYCNNGYTNAPQYYAIRTLPVLSLFV
jgi:hypothetical protein